MEQIQGILSPINLQLILYLVIIIAVFYLFYVTSKKQKQALNKVDESLKRQIEGNQQLNLIVRELRRSNRFLAELVDLEPMGAEMMEGDELPSVASASASSAANSQYKLYVGNIDYTATESELASYFAQYGEVESVNIPINRYTGKARGFGFVSFNSKQDAERAMALHGTEFKGRQIQVNFAKEREMA